MITKNKQLTLSQRIKIEEMLNQRHRKFEIANELDKSQSTIAREIDKHKKLKPHNPLRTDNLYNCKYFGIKADEATLEQFETMLNNFSAVEDGKQSLKAERDNIMASISNDVPTLIKKFSKKKLEEKLGFETVDFSTLYFPKYVFKYVSSGGNTGTEYDIVMDIDNLNRFVLFLSEKIKFQKSAAGQRALMTSKLRQAIKERDHYTCFKRWLND